MNKLFIAVLSVTLFFVVSCTGTENTTITLDQVNGLDDTIVSKGHYFMPLKDVSIITSDGEDITHLLEIEGYVDYGTIGTYNLRYTLDTNGLSLEETRQVEVIDATYVRASGQRPVGPSGTVSLLGGSYLSGPASITHPPSPAFIEPYLLEDAVQSSSWWTTLLVGNYGMSNGIYTNPLRLSYGNEGMEITNPEDGFVQYWSHEGNQTIAQYPIALKDSFIKSTDLNAGYETHVINYSDAHVQVAMRNVGSLEDHIVTTLVQGSPYVFIETANRDALTYTFDTYGVDAYEYFTVSGTPITGSSYQGDGLVVKMTHRHSGYDTSPPANVYGPQYSDKYYLITAPEMTTFTLSSANHPFGLYNQVSMSLQENNMISVAAINQLSEAPFYHQHGYTMPVMTHVGYDIDYKNSDVHTTYTYTPMYTQGKEAMLLALMPHHYKHSDAATTDYTFRTVRGTLKLMASHTFETTLSFEGVVPTFTTPTHDDFSDIDAVTYLRELDQGIDLSDEEDFINDDAPYWTTKAMFPLAQGIIIADQLGEETLQASLILKLKTLLSDWFTYSGQEDARYLYYNHAWGTVYYSDNTFSTASELSDHAFTHGYFIYASAVLSMYDADFYDFYKEMIDFMLDDYMHPTGDASSAYLRNFDVWAGHSWAHGLGTFAEGNNLESTSEVLNSWVAGYLWANQTGDKARRDAAIYGFVTELSAIKEYWFDYDGTNWDPDFGDYVDVAGMVWGGKHDYATWFGANPTFIYGIQMLPTGEYLTSYTLSDSDYLKYQSIFNTYLSAKNQTIDTWFSHMLAVQAITNPTAAKSAFDADAMLNDDYPNELIGSYWMIEALQGMRRTSAVWMGIQLGVTGSVYEKDNGDVIAMLWNSSDERQTVTFYDANGKITTKTVDAGSFITVTVRS